MSVQMNWLSQVALLRDLKLAQVPKVWVLLAARAAGNQAALRSMWIHCGKPLPRDSAPNRSLLEKVAVSHALRAVRHWNRQRSTVFVTDLFDNKDEKTVSKLIRRCTPSEYRVWLKCMKGSKYILSALERLNPRSVCIAGKEPLSH